MHLLYGTSEKDAQRAKIELLGGEKNLPEQVMREIAETSCDASGKPDCKKRKQER